MLRAHRRFQDDELRAGGRPVNLLGAFFDEWADELA